MSTNYSHTKCPKCESTSFEMVEDAPNNAKYKFYYIRCSSCSTFLHACDFFNNNALLEELKVEVKSIKETCERIKRIVDK
jgi:hypothetical protein